MNRSFDLVSDVNKRGPWLVAAYLTLVGCNAPETSTPPPRPADLTAARQQMVREQLTGPGRDIRDPRVLRAMELVPRHEFIPPAIRDQAYEDYPLPIGHGQTISQPFIVAFMTEQLDPQPTDRILEIGTGSGYQAAVLATLAQSVYSIEIVEPLARQAEANLKRLGYDNVKVRFGDGYKGWPEEAPFDAVIVTCAPDHIPTPLIDQLKDGGKMIIPVGQSYGPQELHILTRSGDRMDQRAIMPVRFVPMTGEAYE